MSKQLHKNLTYAELYITSDHVELTTTTYQNKKRASDPVKISSHFAFSTLIMAFSDQVIM